MLLRRRYLPGIHAGQMQAQRGPEDAGAPDGVPAVRRTPTRCPAVILQLQLWCMMAGEP